MFHLSLPVADLAACILFYRDCFDARVVMLGERAANLFVFGGQLTLHERPDDAFDARCRRAMHFGQVVPQPEWHRLRARVEASGRPVLGCVRPAGQTRGKLLVLDPGGNVVEINGEPVSADGC